ncbi:MAG: hypothetical protein EKK29_05835 [Hyphomicrobiales bacterium]|nr:MAG: hypothetical protein EKK29_05835 [Hyphomicrobiales bacterium]
MSEKGKCQKKGARAGRHIAYPTLHKALTLLLPDFEWDPDVGFPDGFISRSLWRHVIPRIPWKPWNISSNQEESLERLDKEINSAITKYDRREYLKNIGLRCPYYLARTEIARIAGETTTHLALVTSSINRERKLKRELKNIQSVLEHLNEPDLLDLFFWPEQEKGIPSDPRKFEGWRRKFLQNNSRIRLLNDVADALKQRIEWEKEVRGPPRADWDSLFIEGLGKLWYGLTGHNPSSSNAFVDFVNAALAGLRLAECSEAKVRTAIERVNGVKGEGGRPKEERFDAFERRR